MTTITKSALVEYSAEQMYRLVDDIPRYADFLPWCREAKEIDRTEGEVRASLDIAHSGLHKSFTTRNRLVKNQSIEIHLVEGPFRHLYGIWRFQPLGDGQASKVTLEMDFEFSSKILSMTFGKVFTFIASSLVDAFVKRAKEIYG